MTALAAALWLGLMLAAPADDKAALTDLQVALEGRQVKVGFVLSGAFDAPALERLNSGLPTGFVYRFRLVRDMPRWFDRELDATELQVAAMYNAVTREYLLNFKQDGRLIESRVVHDLDELQHVMTRFQDVTAFTVDEERARGRLLVRARAILGSRNLLALIPTTVATDWTESRKFRIP